MTRITTTRRQFLKGGLLVTGAACLPMGCMSGATSPKPAVGLQLYTLRDMMAKSVPDTLKLVADTGYSEVEFAGYYEHSAKDIKAMLDKYGLQAPSCHVPLDMINASIDQVIDNALEIGHKYIVMPYLTQEQRGTSIKTYYDLVEQLSTAGEACKKAGITFAYHNHDFEFQVTDGEVPYDVLLNNIDPDVMAMELDLYWTVKAGKDPLDYFAAHPGRFKLFHVKDLAENGEFADVGKGTIDFARIFAKNAESGVEHFFVERDMTDDKIRTISQGYQATSRLLSK